MGNKTNWLSKNDNKGTPLLSPDEYAKADVEGYEFDESKVKPKDDSPIQHYSGALGEFDYDTRQYAFKHNKYGYNLVYIGNETDGSKIKIPDGITSCNHMFEGTDIEIAPKIPESARKSEHMFSDCNNMHTATAIPGNLNNMSYMFSNCKSLKEPPMINSSIKNTYDNTKHESMFEGCSNWVQDAGDWNLRHPGQNYPEPTLFNRGVLSGTKGFFDVLPLSTFAVSAATGLYMMATEYADNVAASVFAGNLLVSLGVSNLPSDERIVDMARHAMIQRKDVKEPALESQKLCLSQTEVSRRQIKLNSYSASKSKTTPMSNKAKINALMAKGESLESRAQMQNSGKDIGFGS